MTHVLVAWYDRHIAARWWASSAMWVGIAAGLVEYLPDWLQMALDNWDVASGALLVDDSTKRVLQALLLFVALPIAKAWRQQKMTEATIVQAVKDGRLAPSPSTDSVVLFKPDGEVSAVVHSAYVETKPGGV